VAHRALSGRFGTRCSKLLVLAVLQLLFQHVLCTNWVCLFLFSSSLQGDPKFWIVESVTSVIVTNNESASELYRAPAACRRSYCQL
jgi:hypothetical protein